MIAFWSFAVAFALGASAFQASRVAVLYVVQAHSTRSEGLAHAVAAALAGLLIGLGSTRRTRALGAGDGTMPEPAAHALVAAAIAVGAGSPLAFVTFDRPASSLVAGLTILAISATTTAASVESFRCIGRAAVALGSLRALLHPFRASLSLLLVFSGAALSAHLGFLATGVLVAAVLLVGAMLVPAVHASLYRPRGATWRGFRVAVAAAAVGIALVARGEGRLAPAAEAARFPGEIVFATDGDAHRYTVVAAPGGYELYRDASLWVASLDEERRAAALARPALARSSHGGRVLLLHGGTGTVERELLRDARVRELVVVADDAVMVRLSRTMPWLAARAHGSLDAPRVRLVVAEPAAYLARDPSRFDVVIDDLPPPVGYLEGKYQTRFYFGLLSDHVDAGGVMATSIPSAFGSRAAFSSALHTLKTVAAVVQPYHAAIPTLGVASFVVGSNPPLRPPEQSLPGVLDEGRDLTPEPDAPLSTLGDQRVVALFQAR